MPINSTVAATIKVATVGEKPCPMRAATAACNNRKSAARRRTAPTAIRLLGPVDVVVGGQPLPLGSGLVRTMLAALAVRAGQVLPAELLIEAMWGAATPRTASHALHVHASTLRKLVPDDLPIVGRPGGYVLQVGPGQLDTDRFEDLAARGRAELSSGHGEAAAALLRDALGLWRGPALADFRYEPFAQAELARLDELRLVCLEERIDADLAMGGGGELVGELQRLVGEHPRRERLRGQLMLALYRSWPQAGPWRPTARYGSCC